MEFINFWRLNIRYLLCRGCQILLIYRGHNIPSINLTRLPLSSMQSVYLNYVDSTICVPKV